ncbi:MAG TPA: hypothetical protein PK020_21530 [Ilumatobacteraceae bacterium]|nr:hypothetical protein [Ilumatobacteraceae bacterium]
MTNLRLAGRAYPAKLAAGSQWCADRLPLTGQRITIAPADLGFSARKASSYTAQESD